MFTGVDRVGSMAEMGLNLLAYIMTRADTGDTSARSVLESYKRDLKAAPYERPEIPFPNDLGKKSTNE